MPFLGYADDLALVDSHIQRLQKRIRLLGKWAESWDGAFNPSKCEIIPTGQYLRRPKTSVQLHGEPIPFKQTGTYLGRIVGGRQPRTFSVSYEALGRSLRHIRCLFRRKAGATTKQLLVFVRALGWAKSLYLAEIYIPHPKQLLAAHWQTIRQVLHSVHRTPRHLLQREVGLLYSPIWWVLKQVIITVYAMTHAPRRGDRTGAEIMMLQERNQTPYFKSVQALLKTFHLRWDDAAAQPDTPELTTAQTKHLKRQLIRKARTAYLEWAEKQIKTEAKRYRTWDARDPAWTLEKRAPRYHSLPLARYGFLHRLPFFNPPPTPPSPCAFCHKEKSDNGLHLAKECGSLPEELQNERASLLKKSGSWQALRLSDKHIQKAICVEWKQKHPRDKMSRLHLHRETIRTMDKILKWMQKTWRARKLMRGNHRRRQEQDKRSSGVTHNTSFMHYATC